MRVEDVMDRDITLLRPARHRRALRPVASGDPLVCGRHSTLPGAEKGDLVGIITRGAGLRTFERSHGETLTVLEAGQRRPVVSHPSETLHDAIARMLQDGNGRRPVIERSNSHKVVGYLGRAGILAARERYHEEEWKRMFASAASAPLMREAPSDLLTPGQIDNVPRLTRRRFIGGLARAADGEAKNRPTDEERGDGRRLWNFGCTGEAELAAGRRALGTEGPRARCRVVGGVGAGDNSGAGDVQETTSLEDDCGRKEVESESTDTPKSGRGRGGIKSPGRGKRSGSIDCDRREVSIRALDVGIEPGGDRVSRIDIAGVELHAAGESNGAVNWRGGRRGRANMACEDTGRDQAQEVF